MDEIRYDKDGNARSFSGEGAVNVFAMAALASGLRLYAKTGMRPNRAWTPTAMMRAAAQHTGKTFKTRDYLGAADALSLKVQAEKDRIERANTPHECRVGQNSNYYGLTPVCCICNKPL